MSRVKIYYPKSEVTTGLYTNGLEWMTDDGEEYIGPYHKYSDGHVMTGADRLPDEKKLIPYMYAKLNPGKAQFRYTKITKVKVDKYKAPQYYLPKITGEEIEQGWFDRYFVQKRNEIGVRSIIEVTKKQSDKMASNNKEVINENLYKKLTLRWKISGTPTDIQHVNRTKVMSANREMDGMISYLGNLLEFSKGYRVWASDAY